MKLVSEVYSRLYHYTNWPGLEGILRSQTMWASNVRYLNDVSELLLAREPICRLLLPTIESAIHKVVAAKEGARAFVESEGGIKIYCRSLTPTIVDGIYRVTGDEFYVLSFCGEPEDHYVKENGLLSQWRAYGTDGGFAIVFDTRKLEGLLQRESKAFEYSPSHISDVIYSDDTQKFESEFTPIFRDFEKYMEAMLAHLIFDHPMPDGSAAMAAIHMCATRYKHCGFKEENEVRVVAAPTIHTREYLAYVESRGEKVSPEKKIKIRASPRKPVPYIELFGFPDCKLPIEKIIVGPGLHKEMTARAVQKLIKDTDIAVTVSDIPYV